MDEEEFSIKLFQILQCPQKCEGCEKRGDRCLLEMRKSINIIMNLLVKKHKQQTESKSYFG